MTIDDVSYLPSMLSRVLDVIVECLEETPTGVPGQTGLYHGPPPADCCLSGETEVVTGEGVFPIADLVGRTVELMTTDGAWVKAPIESFGVQQLHAVHLTRRGEVKTICATAEHRWFVDEFRQKPSRWERREERTFNLSPGDKLAVEGGESWEGYDPEGVLAGIVYGDGSATPWSARVTLYGAKADMGHLFSDYREVQGDRRYPESRGFTGMPNEWKLLPDPGGDRSWLLGWLMGYIATDGSVDGKTVRLASARREALETVRAICYRLGIVTTKINCQWRKGYGDEPSPVFSLSFRPSTFPPDFFVRPDQAERFTVRATGPLDRWTVVGVEVTDRVEEVFCAVVPETKAFVLADNILTGNCDGVYVWLERLYASKGFPGEWSGPINCGELVPVASVAIRLYRPCWPVLVDNANNPFPPSEESDTAAMNLQMDAIKMFCCLLGDLSDPNGVILGGACLKATMGGMDPVTPKGGCAGWTLRFKLELDSCCL